MPARDALLERTAPDPKAPVATPASASPGLLGFTGAGDQAVGADLLLGLQATAGNAGVGRLLTRWGIQRQEDDEPDAGTPATATVPADPAPADAGVSQESLPAGVPDVTPPVSQSGDGGTPATTTSTSTASGTGTPPGGVQTTDGGTPPASTSTTTPAADTTPATDGGTRGGDQPPAPAPKAPAGDRLAALDGKVRELMEQRQDPQAAKDHDDLLMQAELARLAALQYNYAPNTGLVMGLLKPMLPLDQMGERITSLWSGNQYSSGGANSTADKVQAVIEGIRQALRLVGDVVGAGAAVMSYVSIVSGLIALIPPAAPIAGPIAAFSASMSLTLTGIKVVADLIDAVLGIVQGVILIFRARSTDDATERARIAMLLRREANEVSGSLINAGVGAATYGLGKLALDKVPAGQAASQAAQAAAVQAGLAGAARQLLARNFKAAFGRGVWSEMATVSASIRAAQALAKAPQAAGTTVFSMAGLNTKVFLDTLQRETAAAAISAQKAAAPGFSTGAKIWVLGKLRTSLAPKIPSITTKLPAQASKFGQGQGRRQSAVQGESKQDPLKPEGAGVEAPAPEEIQYHYWPSVLERYGQMRKDIKAARDRVQDKHERALEDAGESGKAVLTIKRSSAQSAGKLDTAGQGIGTEAGADEKAAGDRASELTKGKEQEGKAAAERTKSEESREKAKQDADRADQEAIAAAHKAREEPGLLSSASGWVMKKIGNTFKALQAQLAEWILSAAMAAAGLDPKELDLSNLHAGAEKDKETAGKAKEDAGGLSEEEQRQRKAIDQLLVGAGDAEQNAVRGVSDTLDYIRDLDAWDEVLAQAEEGGTAYLEQIAPLLGVQAGPEQPEQAIDAAAVQPVLQGAEYVTLAAADGASGFETRCTAVLDEKLGEARAVFGEYFESVDTTEGAAIGGQFIQQLSQDLHKRLSTAGEAAAQITSTANGLIGSADFAGLSALAKETELVVADIDEAHEQATTACDAGIQELLDAYTAAAVAAVAPAVAAQSEGTPPAEASSGSESTPVTPPEDQTPVDQSQTPADVTPATGTPAP
jgi:hypothetical protein